MQNISAALCLFAADVTGNYSYDYDIVKKKDNKEYMVPKNPRFDFKPKHMTIHLDNLFNGEKFLGKLSNKLQKYCFLFVICYFI